MNKFLKPEMNLTKYYCDSNILNVIFTIKDVGTGINGYYSLFKEYFTHLKCYKNIDSIDKEDYLKISKLILDEELLNKYFSIEFPISQHVINFNKIDDRKYKKFILDNLNRSIMEYSL